MQLVTFSIQPYSQLFLSGQADKDDLGAFRFNDPERNVIIASTDMAPAAATVGEGSPERTTTAPTGTTPTPAQHPLVARDHLQLHHEVQGTRAPAHAHTQARARTHTFTHISRTHATSTHPYTRA